MRDVRQTVVKTSVVTMVVAVAVAGDALPGLVVVAAACVRMLSISEVNFDHISPRGSERASKPFGSRGYRYGVIVARDPRF